MKNFVTPRKGKRRKGKALIEVLGETKAHARAPTARETTAPVR
jgi:hypothetical protein